MFSLLQEKSTIDSKISSLIFFFLLDVLLSKWFNVVSKLTANSWLCAIIQKTKWTIILHL